MTKINIKILISIFLIFLSIPLFAQRRILIKMSSQVPENTPWGAFLNQVAFDWKRITNGQVEIIVYHNGTAGKEDAVVRNLRLNQLQAAVLSTFGMTEIAPEVMTISCPFFIRNDEELELVMNEVKGEIEQKISREGFYTLAWAKIGWVNFFSKTPIYTPDDLKRLKIGTLSEYEKINQAFRTMGFQMVPIQQNELLISLASPMVDAIYNSPVAVGGAQGFGVAKNMSSLNIAPFMGAIVINQRTWASIPDRFKDDLIAATRRREAELERQVRIFESNMIKTMNQYGLTVNQLTPEQEKLFYDEFSKAIPGLVGTVFDRAIYNRIDTILKNYRNRQQ